MGPVTSRLRNAGALLFREGWFQSHSLEHSTSGTTAGSVESAPALHRWRVGAPPEPAVRVQHILVDDESVAQRIYQQLREISASRGEALGQRFEELARAHSRCPSRERGGALGWLRARETTRRFDEAIFQASRPAGTIDLVQSEYGWHVIWIVERQMTSSDRPSVSREQPDAVEEMVSTYQRRPSVTPPDPQYLQMIQQISTAVKPRAMPNVFPTATLLATRQRLRADPPLTHAQALCALIAHRLEPDVWTEDALATAFGIENQAMKAVLKTALQGYHPWIEVLKPDGMRRLYECR
jgi:hypothetical protein